MHTHQELHFALDEILRRFRADKDCSITDSLNATIEDLMKWSAEALDKPNSNLPMRAVIAIEEKTDGTVRVIPEFGTEHPSNSPVGDMLGFLMDRARQK